jgi:phospholipid/cholesterol/gamma-HCH transport system ATP-binding protein
VNSKLELKSIESLKFENLTFGFDGHAETFKQVDFEFPMNDIVWVQAESGSGRSTLMQILAGLIHPNHGKYLVNGKDVLDMSFEEFLPYRLSIGYGFDMGGLLHNKTLKENLMLPLLYHKILDYKKAEERVHEYLDLFGVIKHKDKRPSVVPGGTRKLTCLIRALILHPQVLLLDEPTVGLNQATALTYFDLIQLLRSENLLKSVYISSFDEKIMSIVQHKKIYIHENKLTDQQAPNVRGIAI